MSEGQTEEATSKRKSKRRKEDTEDDASQPKRRSSRRKTSDDCKIIEEPKPAEKNVEKSVQEKEEKGTFIFDGYFKEMIAVLFL